MADSITLRIELTLEEHLQILDERRGGMCKSSICNTKPEISQKRSSLELELLHDVYRNSCTAQSRTAYRLVTNLVT